MGKRKKNSQKNQSLNSVVSDASQVMIDEQQMANSINVSGAFATDSDGVGGPKKDLKKKKKSKHNK